MAGNLNHIFSLLGAAAFLLPCAHAFTCSVVTRRDTTNFGPGISLEAHEGLTPFAIGDWNAIISFDEDHCIKMCCEQLECHVAVFDHTEAVCYLKGAGATHTYDFVKQEGFSAFEMLIREGFQESIELEPTTCSNKKGIAYDFQSAIELETLSQGMSWWYNWAPGIIDSDVNVAQATSGDQYIPMIWGEKDMTTQRLSNLAPLEGHASHLLGFNEPNFGAQADLSPQEAADLWPTVKAQAELLNADLVSPAVNYCGGNCVEQDPFVWLDEFMAACALLDGGCGISAIAVHTYVCEVTYLNKMLHGYLKYGLPLWLTEFACADDSSLVDADYQATYASEALLLLELHPSVERYAWFTGRGADEAGVPGANLFETSGALTPLGEVFFNSYKGVQHCGAFTNAIASDDSTSSSSSDSSATSPSIAVPGESVGGSDVDEFAKEVTNVMITNLGGTGVYNEVVNMITGEDMHCSAGASACEKEEVSVSGNLAPFDEPQTVAFRGPLNLHNLAWYEGSFTSVTQASRWTPTTSDNVVFLKNLGGPSECSGEWTICGGSSQSYADGSGEGCSDKPTQFMGKLDRDEEVNILTSEECTAASCGFYRGTGLHGWGGGSDGTKVLVFEVDMPHCGKDDFDECTYDRPAVWALNAKVVRTAQYGCNCRGMGGNGGCGEFDIIEAVIGNENSDMLFTTVYDFKGTGSPGFNKYFLRPSEPTHFAAIYRGGSSPYLQVVQLVDWDYTQTTISGAFLNELRDAAPHEVEIYDVPEKSPCSGMSANRPRFVVALLFVCRPLCLV